MEPDLHSRRTRINNVMYTRETFLSGPPMALVKLGNFGEVVTLYISLFTWASVP